jgi:hypothetical protein
MEYTDLEAAGVRNQNIEARYKDIYAGEVRAGDEILFFEPVNLYNNKFSVMLPNSYKDLPKSMAKIKYPMENRPAVIKTNNSTSVNFGFAYYNQEFTEEQVESAANGLKTGLGRITAGARFFETEILKTEAGVKFSCFGFYSKALDAEMYQVFAFIPVHRKFLHVTFNAPSKLMRTWQPVVYQVFRSVREVR